MTLTLSLPFLLLAGFSLLLFIGVTIFCHHATIVYLICWAVPSLLAWAVWATWWR